MSRFLWRCKLPVQRIDPGQIGKTREVSIVRVERSPVFQGVGGQSGVRDEGTGTHGFGHENVPCSRREPVSTLIHLSECHYPTYGYDGDRRMGVSVNR